MDPSRPRGEGLPLQAKVAAVAGVVGGDLLLRGFEGGVDVWWQGELRVSDRDRPVDTPDGACGLRFVEYFEAGVADWWREAEYEGGVDFA